MTYTEQDMRRVMNEAYRAGVEEGIKRARKANNVKPPRPQRLHRTTTPTTV